MKIYVIRISMLNEAPLYRTKDNEHTAEIENALFLKEEDIGGFSTHSYEDLVELNIPD